MADPLPLPAHERRNHLPIWAGAAIALTAVNLRTSVTGITPLLEMNDPGDPPLRGGLLVAPLGRGTYVYTGLALFRQFPEGVPGAYRILANLVSLGVKP